MNKIFFLKTRIVYYVPRFNNECLHAKGKLKRKKFNFG